MWNSHESSPDMAQFGTDDVGLQRSSFRAYVAIRSAIREGLFDADQPLDDRVLSRSLNFTRSATRSALQTLGKEGFLQRQKRVGTKLAGQLFDSGFADHRPATYVGGQAGDERVSILHIETGVVTAPPWVRKVLAIESEHALIYESRVVSGAETLALQLMYYPPDLDPSVLFERGLEIDSTTSYETLAERFRYLFDSELGEVLTSIEAVACDAQVAEQLGVAEGSPILLREYVMRDADGRAMVLAYNFSRGDRIIARVW